MKAKDKNCLILTMKLGENYGGIIQAYALQSFIKKIGYRVATSTPTKTLRLKRRIGDIKRSIFNNSHFIVNIKEEQVMLKNTLSFIESNINIINFYNKFGFQNSKINSFKNVIVGSDQVWRAKYVDIKKYMLAGVNEKMNRLSYAASFGIDNSSEYNPKLIGDTKKLAKKFKAISVREDSGIKLCKEMWGVDAVQNIDPTLLLDKADYLQLIKKETSRLHKNSGIFSYILDRTNEKKQITQRIEKKLNLKSFEIMPPICKSRKEFKSNPNKFTLPPVEQWLKSFDDAEFVITDSFHGCVFSIIFNKPFIAIGNKSRGLTRFTSLLKLFNLENRLIIDPSGLNDKLILEKIDWENIKKIIIKEQEKFTKFLKQNLMDKI